MATERNFYRATHRRNDKWEYELVERGSTQKLKTPKDVSFYSFGDATVKDVDIPLKGTRVTITEYSSRKIKGKRVGSFRGITTGKNIYDDRIVTENYIHWKLRQGRELLRRRFKKNA